MQILSESMEEVMSMVREKWRQEEGPGQEHTAQVESMDQDMDSTSGKTYLFAAGLIHDQNQTTMRKGVFGETPSTLSPLES